MMPAQTSMADIFTDFNGLGQLKAAAANQKPNVNQEVAQQFESMFLQMLLKSMRQTVSKGMLNSSQVEMSQNMYDQQLAIQLSKQGGLGIGDLVLREINRSSAISDQPNNRTSSVSSLSPWANISGKRATPASSITSGKRQQGFTSPEQFIETLRPAVDKAATKLGVDPKAILAIAGLETGWGKHILHDHKGNSSHNLFGIKADKNWKKGQIQANTLEFAYGAMHKRTEPFRVYRSIEESVQDFANFILQNPRYEQALKHSHDPNRFIEELHKAGYATDPDYARKVKAVMQTVSRKLTAHPA